MDIISKKTTFAHEIKDPNMEEKIEYPQETYQKLGDAIVWTTILAAVHKDGVIEEDERAEAIKQTHLRSVISEPYLKPIYEHLNDFFEEKFDAYMLMLPDGYDAKESFIQAKIEESSAVLKEMGPVFTAVFSQDLKSLFDRVFNANTSVFQSFLFPFFS